MAAVHKRPFAKGLEGVDLTPMQRTFVLTLVRQGCTPTQAARVAGYADPKVSAHDLLRSAHIQTAIRFERSRYVMGDLANVATATLKDVMTDAQAPASARVAAARTVLELAGELGRGKTDAAADRPLSELTADELARLIDQWEGERATLVTPEDGERIALDDAISRGHLPH